MVYECQIKLTLPFQEKDRMIQRELEFQKIHDNYRPKILRYLTHMAGNDEAEDLTQEVFDKVGRGLQGFREESKLSTWIYRIATHTALDRMKTTAYSRSRKESALEKSAEVEDRDVWSGRKKIPVDQELIRREMSACVREFVDRLPPDYRTVIILSELEGFKNREIADILQVSLDTLKIRLHRARASLKKLLDEGCDFYHNEQATLACDRKPPIIKLKKTD